MGRRFCQVGDVLPVLDGVALPLKDQFHSLDGISRPSLLLVTK